MRLPALCGMALTAAVVSGCATGTVELRGAQVSTQDPLRVLVANTTFNHDNANIERICGERPEWQSGITDELNLSSLDMRCALLNADGRPATIRYGVPWVTPCRGNWSDVPTGPHRIAVTARCQPDGSSDVTVVPANLSGEPRTPATLEIPLPSPERRFTRPGASFVGINRRVRRPIDLPPNTVVDVVRKMPDRTGACTRALLRVIDAGEMVSDAEIVLGDLRDLSPAAFDGPSAQEYMDTQRAKEREKLAAKQSEERQRTQAAEMMTAEEIKSGRCSQEHFDQLQTALGKVSFLFDRTGNSDGFKLLTSDVIVAKPTGGEESIEFKGRGELHFFAMGDSLEAMRVTNPEGYHMSGVSQWQRLVATTGLKTAGVAVQAQAGTYRVSVKGKGCAMVMVFLKYL